MTSAKYIKFIVLVVAGLLSGLNGVLAADTTAPSAARGFDAASGPSGYELALTWTNPQDEDLDHIDIYFGTSGGYFASLFKTVSATPNTKGQSSITDLSSGTDYFLFLKAVDKSGNKSSATTEIKRRTGTFADTTSPSAVSAFDAKDLQTGGAVSLSWNNPTEEDFFQSRIYRSDQSDFVPSAENQIAIVFGLPAGQGIYTDTGLANKQVYYYKIRTEDNRGNIQTGLFYPLISATPTFVEVAPPPAELPPVEEPDPLPASNIVDGDLIRATGTQDIYIVKIVGAKKFKRLILNPEIFNSYGHLKWENVKDVSANIVGAFTNSDLIIEINLDGSVANPKVYRVSSAEGSDKGEKRWLNMTATEFETAGYDWDAIYKINQKEASADFYPEGSPVVI